MSQIGGQKKGSDAETANKIGDNPDLSVLGLKQEQCLLWIKTW